jgi:PKD repeat protein
MPPRWDRLVERRLISGRRQAGFGLLEAMIGMVMVILLIGAGTTGLKTLQNTSRGANQISRLDAVLVGASETLRSKGTKYVDCAQPTQYEQAILAADQNRQSAGDQLLQSTSAGTSALVVTDVDAPGCDTVNGDSGRQTVTLEATGVDGTTRSARVTKIDPERRLLLPTAVIDTPVQQSSDGDARAVFSLTATNSTTNLPQGLAEFEWDCGPDAEVVPSNPSPQTFPSASQQMICQFLADTVPKTVTVSLKVTDGIGQTDTATRTITLAARTDPRPNPIAVASATPMSINPGQTVNFNSVGSAQPAGSIVAYSWDFRDAPSGSANTATTPTAAHTFFRAGTYQVKLTVTDDVGLTASDTVPITVSTPVIPLPVARFTIPGTTFYAPASVNFDGRASTAHPNVAVSEYNWDYGDGTTGTGGTAVHQYLNPGSFDVVLTVKDAGGQQATTTRRVTVKVLEPPSDFQAIGSRAKFPCIFFGCPGAHTGYMDFGWTKLVPGPGQQVSIEINIIEGANVGICWDNASRIVPQSAGTGYQRFRWEEPNLDILNLGKTFCSGTRYEYKMRARVTSGGTTKEGSWGPTKYWTV